MLFLHSVVVNNFKIKRRHEHRTTAGFEAFKQIVQGRVKRTPRLGQGLIEIMEELDVMREGVCAVFSGDAGAGTFACPETSSWPRWFRQHLSTDLDPTQHWRLGIVVRRRTFVADLHPSTMPTLAQLCPNSRFQGASRQSVFQHDLLSVICF